MDRPRSSKKGICNGSSSDASQPSSGQSCQPAMRRRRRPTRKVCTHRTYLPCNLLAENVPEKRKDLSDEDPEETPRPSKKMAVTKIVTSDLDSDDNDVPDGNSSDHGVGGSPSGS